MGTWRGCRSAQSLLVCLLAAWGGNPCYGQATSRWKRVWKVSVAVLAAANVADASTSAGCYEANPLLQNRQRQFSAGRAIAVKSAASGGLLLVQLLMMKRRPEERLEKPAAILNFAAAAAVGSVSYRNTKTR